MKALRPRCNYTKTKQRGVDATILMRVLMPVLMLVGRKIGMRWIDPPHLGAKSEADLNVDQGIISPSLVSQPVRRQVG